MWEPLNNIAQTWWNWQWPMLWQTALLIGIIVVIDLLIRKWAWPQLRYSLWLLVLVKLLLPPGLASSVSVTAPLSKAAQQHIMTSQPASTPLPKVEATAGQLPTSIEPKVGMGSIDLSTVTATPVIEKSPLIHPIEEKTTIVWQVYVMAIWITGVLGLALILATRLHGLRRTHPATGQQIPEWYVQELRQAAKDLKVRRLPQVVISNRVCCPAVFGLFRPILLIPEESLDSLNPTDARHILLHELAHIARGDLLIHSLHMLLLIAYWPNPLLWLMRKHLQNLRELCCDTTVARHLKDDTPAYRETLIETAKGLLAQPVDPGLGLLGLFENSSWILTRLQWLEKKTWRYWRLRITMVALVVLIMSTCVLPMAQTKHTVTGRVTDTTTGEPLAGVKVHDEGYGDPPNSTVTDHDGRFSLSTANEEHFIKVHIEGYESQEKLLKTFPFSNHKAFDFKLQNLASSPWVTLDKYNGHGDSVTNHRIYGAFTISPPTEENNRTSIRVTSHIENYDTRLIALDINDVFHFPIATPGVSAPGIAQTTYEFDIPREQLVSFHFQVNPQADAVSSPKSSQSHNHLQNIKLLLKIWIDSNCYGHPVIQNYNSESEETIYTDRNWNISLDSVSWTHTQAWGVSNPLPDPNQDGAPQFLIWHLDKQNSGYWRIEYIELVSANVMNEQSHAFLADHPEACNTVDRIALDLTETILNPQLEQPEWTLSLERMKHLRTMIELFYAAAGDWPVSIDEMRERNFEDNFTEGFDNWLKNNLVFRGHLYKDLGRNFNQRSVTPLAYDQVILNLTGQSPVMFVGGAVQSLTQEQLLALGVNIENLKRVTPTNDVLVLAQPEYEWWLKEPKQQIVINEGDELGICWEIEQELYEEIDWFAVGVLHEGVNVSENHHYHWLAVDIPATVRSTSYGKIWPSKLNEMNTEAKPLVPGNYTLIVFGFASGGGHAGSRDWTFKLKNNYLKCSSTAKLIVNANPNSSPTEQSHDIPTQFYTVQPGDTLESIGNRFQIPWQWIAKTNEVAPETLLAYQNLTVITGPVHAKVYRSSCKLELYADGIVFETYKVGLGQEGHVTPTGLWRIRKSGKMIRPQWTDAETGQVYQGDEPDYPLGERWIGLKGIEGDAIGKQGYAIHGSNNLESIEYATNGCIRISNQDVIEVYDLLLEGVSTVEVVE